MPPKQKYTRDLLVKAALELVREGGIEAVSAREIGRRLGCTVSPIFSYFADMEELRRAVKEAAWEQLEQYLRTADEYVPAFKMRGMQLIRFAKEEPQLFRLLFDGETAETPSRLLLKRIEGFRSDIAAIQRDYDLSEAAARHLLDILFTQTYGICLLRSSGICDFSESQIASSLGAIFIGTLRLLRTEESPFADLLPVKRESPEGTGRERPLPFRAKEANV